MDCAGYSKWDRGSEDVPRGHWRHWLPHTQKMGSFLALGLLVATVLWVLALSILFSKASTERRMLLGHQELLTTNASEQTAALGALKEELGACRSCCSGTKEQLQTTVAELKETQAKLLQQESTLKELGERVTRDLAAAGRDRENIRKELFQALEAARFQNSSCQQCPLSWLPFQGSCYFFSEPLSTWEAAQQACAREGAHLAIITDLEEQSFLSRNTRGRGYWLGLRAVRHQRKINGYQWVDGVSLGFSYWNKGEPNDSRGHEDCVMMLHTGMWNDAPCGFELDGSICEKRSRC